MAYIFSIEGNIAAGKTTLLKKLKETSNLKGYPILFIEEPVEVWETIKDSEGKNILQHFYDDNVKYAFPFQMIFQKYSYWLKPSRTIKNLLLYLTAPYLPIKIYL